VKALTDLRASVCCKAPEAYTRGLQDLLKYNGLFASVQKRFPMSSDDRTLTFTWAESLIPSSMFKTNKKSCPDGNFEAACLMYNLGALHAQVARGSDVTNDEGQKAAIDCLQKAAAYFKTLAAFVKQRFAGAVPALDLDPAFLDAVSKVMLAQAQEVVFAKAVNKAMKPELVAKISWSCCELYGEVSAVSGISKISKMCCCFVMVRDLLPLERSQLLADMHPLPPVCVAPAPSSSSFYQAISMVVKHKDLDGPWTMHLRAKCDYYASEAHYRMSIAHGEKSEWGAHVSRLREAVRIAQGAAGVANGLPFAGNIAEYIAKLSGVLKKSESDNSLIYCETVPAPSSLEAITGQKVVKDDKPLPDCDSVEVRGPDPFEKLLPVSIKKGQDEYVTAREGVVNDLRTQLSSMTSECVDALEVMNLPSALQATTNPDSVPESLATKSAEIQSLGGAEKLQQMVAALDAPRTEIKRKLEDAKQLLDAEEKEDAEMRGAHGTAKWSRTPSAEVNGKTRAEGFKLQGWLTAAVDGDSKIQAEFDASHSGIVVLTKPVDELNKILPSAGGAIQRSSSGRDTSGVDELTALMATLDACRKENDGLLSGVLTTVGPGQVSDEITQSLLSHSSGDVDQASLFAQQLSRFDAVRVQTDALVARTKGAIEETRRANDVFVASRSADTSSNERERMLADLSNHGEQFHKILKNITEGTNFYTKLSAMATTYHNKVNDFCAARKIEKQSLLADISQAAAAAAAVPAPAPMAAAPPAHVYTPPAAAAAPPPAQQPAYHQPYGGQQQQSSNPAPAAQQQYGGGGPGQPPPQQQQQQQQPYSSYGQAPYGAPTNPYGAPAPASAPPVATNPYGGGLQPAAPYQPDRSGSGPPGYQQALGQPPPQAPAAGTNPYAHNPYGAPQGYQPTQGQGQGGMPGVQFAPPQQQQQQYQPQQQQYGAAPRANSGPTTEQWSCPACSFFNSMLLPACEMCDHARP
jgi:programmed cell death 6-interacting protein